MKKIAQNAMSIYLVVILLMIIKNILPIHESLQGVISSVSLVVVLAVFFIERRVNPRRRKK